MIRACLLAISCFVLSPSSAIQATEETVEKKSTDVLEGTLRIHPKFHYRYYVDGFGDGQHCALYGADEQLKKLAVGSRIRVEGKLAAKYFDTSGDPTAALVSAWIIYIDVAKVSVIDGPPKNVRSPPVKMPWRNSQEFRGVNQVSKMLSSGPDRPSAPNQPERGNQCQTDRARLRNG